MSRDTALALLLLLAPLLTGCGSLQNWWHNGLKVGPNYGRPLVQVADDWIDSPDPSVVVQSEELADWWRVFNDPTLDQLVLAAYQRNLTLRVAGLRVIEARTQRRIAAANLFPQSQAGFGTYSHNRLSQSVATAFPFGPRDFSDWQTGFDLSWELDVWGRLRRSIEAADANLDAEIENYDAVMVTLIGDVVTTYIDLRSFDQRITLAERNAEIQAGSLEITKARFANGRVSELDVQQATANLADTRALIPTLKQGRRLALNGLAILLGTTPYELQPILSQPGTIPYVPPEVVVGIPADLLRRRPDVRNAERLVAVQSAQIGIAEADLYPQFAINGEIKVNSEDFDELFTSPSFAGTVAPGFRWKILNYGRLVNNIRIQDLRFQQAVIGYENTVLAAHREVEDAMAQFLQSQEQAEQLNISSNATERSVELVRIQYKEGATDFGRVFVLEASLVAAQDQLIASRASVAIGLARVYKALGGGWQVRQVEPYCGEFDLHTIPSWGAMPEDGSPVMEPPVPTIGEEPNLEELGEGYRRLPPAAEVDFSMFEVQ